VPTDTCFRKKLSADDGTRSLASRIFVRSETEYLLNCQYLTYEATKERAKLDGLLRAEVSWKVQETTRGVSVGHGNVRGSRKRGWAPTGDCCTCIYQNLRTIRETHTPAPFG
jgi:hypothetical protein